MFFKQLCHQHDTAHRLDPTDEDALPDTQHQSSIHMQRHMNKVFTTISDLQYSTKVTFITFFLYRHIATLVGYLIYSPSRNKRVNRCDINMLSCIQSIKKQRFPQVHIDRVSHLQTVWA